MHALFFPFIFVYGRVKIIEIDYSNRSSEKVIVKGRLPFTDTTKVHLYQVTGSHLTLTPNNASKLAWQSMTNTCKAGILTLQHLYQITRKAKGTLEQLQVS